MLMREELFKLFLILSAMPLILPRREFVMITKEEKIKDGSIMVSVKDTGSGIDPQILPRLFTKFTTGSEKGTGLGLYICKRNISHTEHLL
jgi:signal transduction histidine kinase